MPTLIPAPAAYNPPMKTKPSMREHLLKVREGAIIDVVNQLLADKGYDLMTVDEVAANAGLSKASLYTHFRSKEELAAAAMVLVLERALAFVQSAEVQTLASPLERLRAVVRWTLRTQLAGAMPSLPAQNSSLRAFLGNHKGFNRLLFQLSDALGEWIEAAQAQGQLDPQLPGEVVLYSLYARACDQVLQVLKAGKQYDDEQIVEWILRSCFFGLTAPTSQARSNASTASAARKPTVKRAAKGA